jgi:hypothetical protein
MVEEEQHIHHLRTNIFAPEEPPHPGPSAAMDNDKHSRHAEKQTPPYPKKDEKTKPPI